MLFLKKCMMGMGALFLIFVGGAGTQSSSLLLQGGGFLGLIVGLVILYIFAKMAWRAMGCLPAVLAILAIVGFILYAIGGFNGGISNIGDNIKSFLGQSSASISNRQQQANASASTSTINLLDDEDMDISISETFSSPQNEEEGQKKPPSQPQQAEEESGGWMEMIFGKKKESSSGGIDFDNLPTIYSTVRVVSGDTLSINGRLFRLYGIDAPEMNQNCADANGRAYGCGRQAAAWLSSWLQDNPVECKIMQQDKNGNMAGTCSLGAYDIGAALVNAGWAVAYTKHTDIYLPYQQQAQNNTSGLWQGEFYMPWDWRKIQARKPNIKIIKQKPKRKRTILNPLG